MALTTVPLRLVKTPEPRRRTSVLRSIAVALLGISVPLLAGCGPDGVIGDSALSKAENGHKTVTINLSPIKLAFSASQGESNPPGQAVAISNSGTGKLSWSVSTDGSWLSVSPTSGTGAGSFTATAIIPGLATGTYSATISVVATGATNTPQSIPVSLTVSAATSQPTTTSASLTWQPNPDPTVVGFFVHYGTQSPNSSGSCAYDHGTYVPHSAMTASSPTATISNLATGATFYFAVSAYNGSSESTCSNEVFKAT